MSMSTTITAPPGIIPVDQLPEDHPVVQALRGAQQRTGSASTTPADHQVQIQPRGGVNTASPAVPSFVDLLEAGLAGGNATYDFFAGHFSALQTIYETVATGGDEVWIDGVDSVTQMPVKYVAIGSHFLCVNHQYTDTDPMKNGTGGNDTYKPVGISIITFTTDQGTSQFILNDVHYAGMGVGVLLATPVLAKFALSIVKSVASWIKNTAIRIYTRASGGGSEDPEDAEEAVEGEAGEAAEESGEAGAEVASGVFADVTITVAQGVLFVVGMGILAVVFILQLLAKQINAQVRFYNLTKQDIPVGIGFVADDTGMSSGPAAVGSTASVTKVSKPAAPPYIISSDLGIYYAEAALLNTSELHGVGYVLNAEPSADFPGFRVGVEIPNAGDNTLLVQFGDTAIHDFWIAFGNPDGPATTALTMSATAGPYTLRIATNVDSGRSPAPLTGETGYNYQHLIVLTDGSVPA